MLTYTIKTRHWPHRAVGGICSESVPIRVLNQRPVLKEPRWREVLVVAERFPGGTLGGWPPDVGNRENRLSHGERAVETWPHQQNLFSPDLTSHQDDFLKDSARKTDWMEGCLQSSQ